MERCKWFSKEKTIIKRMSRVWWVRTRYSGFVPYRSISRLGIPASPPQHPQLPKHPENLPRYIRLRWAWADRMSVYPGKYVPYRSLQAQPHRRGFCFALFTTGFERGTKIRSLSVNMYGSCPVKGASEQGVIAPSNSHCTSANFLIPFNAIFHETAANLVIPFEDGSPPRNNQYVCQFLVSPGNPRDSNTWTSWNGMMVRLNFSRSRLRRGCRMYLTK